MITPRPFTRDQLRVRFVASMAVVALVFLGLGGRLFYLQVLRGQDYRYQSENNRIRIERLAPPRGMIHDRNGVILAGTSVSFDAYVIPSELTGEQAPEICEKTGALLGMRGEEVAAVLEPKRPARWKPRMVKRRLSWEEMAKLEARRIELPGVYVAATPVRDYPYGEMMAPALGYMGGITPAELALSAMAEYDGSDYLGRTGLEKVWEGMLRGRPGGAQVEVDVLGRRLGVLAEQPAVPGHNLELTLDWRIQHAAETALGDQTGSVVALDVRTGGVLAMASSPSFDPNLITVGMTAEEWKSLSEDSRHPLQNRSVRGQYAPGSTFKLIMALAGLDFGVITPKTRVYCAGAMMFAGREFRCWKKEGHGEVDLAEAIEQSCDVYFYELGLTLGINTIHDYAVELGLGEITGIDLTGEKGGTVPSKAWKRKALGEPWYPGETISNAIGQGYVLATPLQLAAMTAAIAHPSGARMRPHLVKRIVDPLGTAVLEIPDEEVGRISFQATHLDVVRDAMRRVVEAEKGTAKRARIDGMTVAGKTGTSQVISRKEGEELDTEAMAWRYRDHALFVAYAPMEDPRYAVAVVVEHGGHGGVTAAPVARAVLEACRDADAGELASREAAR